VSARTPPNRNDTPRASNVVSTKPLPENGAVALFVFLSRSPLRSYIGPETKAMRPFMFCGAGTRDAKYSMPTAATCAQRRRWRGASI